MRGGRREVKGSSPEGKSVGVKVTLSEQVGKLLVENLGEDAWVSLHSNSNSEIFPVNAV